MMGNQLINDIILNQYPDHNHNDSYLLVQKYLKCNL